MLVVIIILSVFSAIINIIEMLTPKKIIKRVETSVLALKGNIDTRASRKSYLEIVFDDMKQRLKSVNLFVTSGNKYDYKFHLLFSFPLCYFALLVLVANDFYLADPNKSVLRPLSYIVLILPIIASIFAVRQMLLAKDRKDFASFGTWINFLLFCTIGYFCWELFVASNVIRVKYMAIPLFLLGFALTFPLASIYYLVAGYIGLFFYDGLRLLFGAILLVLPKAMSIGTLNFFLGVVSFLLNGIVDYEKGIFTGLLLILNSITIAILAFLTYYFGYY